jgi:hypothetical protein
VQVIARLGRETQLHLDERYRHFRITDGVIIATSLLLVILAVFNVYFVRVLYEDLNGIVANMESMHGHLQIVDEDMEVITERMAAFDTHMTHLEPIHQHMSALSGTLPKVRASMDGITGYMTGIEQSMGLVGQGMGIIDQRDHAMIGGVATMRENVRQFARPLGGMGTLLP